MHAFLKLLTFTLLAPLAYAYSNPEPCSGSCEVHDPAVIRRSSDGVFFRFSTGDKIAVATADSLSGPWTEQGSVIPDGSSIDMAGNTDLWAPDVTEIDGTYYLFYAVSTFGSQNSAIGVSTSTTMEVGSWVDHGATGLESSSSKLYNAIDPNLISTSSGEYFLSFGSFYDDIYQVKLSSDLLKTSGDAYNLAFNSTGDHALEGSFIYERSGYYYLFFSAGQCCGFTEGDLPAAGEEYKIMVCRSTSAAGNFVDKTGKECSNGGGTEVLASHGNVYAPGGQGVMVDPSIGSVLYYHYIDTSLGYSDGDARFGWNQISWSDGWPSV